MSCKMISNEGKVWEEFTITPGNPPASDQDPAQTLEGVDSDQLSTTQQIPLTKPSLLPLPLPSLQLENEGYYINKY